ncbi:hypothetical protein ACOMHN_058583 [Nucella lapillus]
MSTGDQGGDVGVEKDVEYYYRPGGRRNDGLKAADIVPVLRERVAYLSGGRDKRGGPILTFPSHTHPERLKYDDLRRLMTYLASVPSDEVREKGFTVILDMRGSKWETVKPVLKGLQECFPGNINMAYIIKPGGFWEKQRTSLGSAKYNFETNMISLDNLTKVIETSQLTRDFDGSLEYDHEQWIQLRLMLEEFIWKALDLLDDTTPHHTTPHHTTPHHTTLDHTIPYHTIPIPIPPSLLVMFQMLEEFIRKALDKLDDTTPHHTTPHHTTPHHTHTTPHHTIPIPIPPSLLVMFQMLEEFIRKALDLLDKLDDTIPYHTTPHHTTPYHTTPHHTTPYHTIPHHTYTYTSLSVLVMFQMLEEFIWKALDLLDKLDELGEILTNPELPDDLVGAQHVLEEHNLLKRRVTLAPVEQLSMEGHHILTKITGEIPGQSGSVGRRAKISGNTDFQSAVPQISQLLDNLQSTKQHLNQLWVVKKMRLEQCLQLRIFEEDVEKMFEWISHNRDLFLVNYTEIGTCHQMAVELESEHCQFATSAENVYVNITRILSMAQRMCDAGHYASNMIRVEAGRLEREWKSLAAALEDRSTVLRMSVIFHKKAEMYLAHVIVWQSTCENTKIPTNIEELEEALQSHQDLIENISQTYAEVCGDGKALLDTLQTPVSSSSANSITAKADYSEAAGHVLDVVHEVLAHQRHLEHIWHSKKVKLHQRLGLRLFQQDVKQVIDWLNNHGDVFLKKNTSIGKTLQRAKALQKSHEHFESVARNTITNAEKLLAAADELAQTGECDPKEIYGEAHELEQRMHNFLSALERRRGILDMTVAFYTHVHELTNWLEDLHGELQSCDMADTVEGAEQLLAQFTQQRQTTLEAAINTVSEGQTLLEQLR